MEDNCCVTPTEELAREREEIVRDAQAKFDVYIFNHIEMLKGLSLDETANVKCGEDYQKKRDELGQALADIILIQERIDCIDKILLNRKAEDEVENTKEVYFNIYCKTCEHKEKPGTYDPCNECLANPCNTDSHKPVCYKETT